MSYFKFFEYGWLFFTGLLGFLLFGFLLERLISWLKNSPSDEPMDEPDDVEEWNTEEEL